MDAAYLLICLAGLTGEPEELGFGGVSPAAEAVPAEAIPAEAKHGLKRQPAVAPRRRPSPFDAVVPDVEELPSPPLVRFRREAEAARQRREARRGGAASASDEGTAQILAAALSHLEEIAHRRMRACMAKNRLSPPPPLPPQRMTAGGPVPWTAEELAAVGPEIEPYPCERVRVVDEALVRAVRRYHEIQYRLQHESFGWARRDEKTVLRKEATSLLDVIEPDNPLRHYRIPRPMR